MRNDKVYKFSEKSDYVFYLSEIIIDVVNYGDRLSRYQKEMEKILNSNKDKKLVDSFYYESLSDKIKSLL